MLDAVFAIFGGAILEASIRVAGLASRDRGVRMTRRQPVVAADPRDEISD